MQTQKRSKAKWARVLAVSCSGYYNWQKEGQKREAKQAALVERVRKVFKAGKGHYGAERVCGIIRREGGKASFGKVKVIMDERGWVSSHCRRHPRSMAARNKARQIGYSNLVEGLEITQPFQALASDISYIATKEGNDYLCQVRDLYTNLVLGFAQQSRMTADIVLKALDSMQGRWQLPRGVIFHSDRGSQYTAREVKERLNASGFRQSFSEAGKPGQNAWSESFFSVLKKEIIHKKPCLSREEARYRIFDYIETYYNSSRVQKRLGYLTPLKFLSECTLPTKSLP